MKSLKEYRRYLRPAALALGAAAFLLPSSAFAADTGIVDGINFLLKFISILLTPFVYMAGWLLSPSWTMGDVIGLRPHLHGMWVLVSNIVYTIFALALLGIAFVNIFNVGGEKGKYELKAMLPKFVVGILIVPFSWFAVSATLSVANLLTASVLQLPASVIPNAPASMSGVFIPALITLDFSAKSTAGTGVALPDAAGTSTGYVQTADCSLAANQTQGEGRKCVPVYEAITGQGTYSPLVYYVYGIFHIQDSQILKEGGLKGIATLADLAMSVAIELLLIVVLFVVTLALFAALAIRAVVLWAYIVFSPVFGLMYFLDGSFKFADKVAEKVSFGKFLSLAMVPVYVSAALAFGIIFLNSATNFGGGTEISGDGITLKAENGGATFDNGSVKIVMKGGEGAADAKKLVDYGLGRLLFSGFALVILYLSVMAALKANEITGMVVEPIDRLAKMAAKSAPILPGGMSVNAVKEAAKLPEAAISQIDRAKIDAQRTSFFDKMGINDSLNRAMTAQTGTSRDVRDAHERAQKLLSSGSAQQFARNDGARSRLVERLKEMGINDPAVLKGVTDARTEMDFAKAMLGVEHAVEAKGLGADFEFFEGKATTETQVLRMLGKDAAAQKAVMKSASLEATSDPVTNVKDPSGKDVTVTPVKMDGSVVAYTNASGLAAVGGNDIDSQKKVIAQAISKLDLANLGKDEADSRAKLETFLKDKFKIALADVAGHIKIEGAKVEFAPGAGNLAKEWPKTK